MSYLYLLDTNIISELIKNPRGVIFSKIQSVGEDTAKKIYQAIRNRGYTNEVRLRGLKEFETHGGGFCLYSREFHSPGQVGFYSCDSQCS